MTEPVSNRDETRPALLAVLVLLFAIAWFANLDYRKLVRPDEGRYAEIAREMAVTGDWVTPRLNAVKYFEKPPLQYWATASAFKTFGEHEWTARLWTGLTGFGGVLLVFLRAGRCSATAPRCTPRWCWAAVSCTSASGTLTRSTWA